MTLRLKIFFLGLFIALFVGLLSSVMFARSWKTLAQSYALSSLEARIVNFEALKNLGTADNEWALETDLKLEGLNWVVSPKNMTSASLPLFTASIAQAIQKTHLSQGTFEVSLPLISANKSESFMMTFRRDEKLGKTLIAGISSETSLLHLSAWAAPFAGILAIGVIVAALVSFLISSRLNSAYIAISKGLAAIANGRLNEYAKVESNDPAVQMLSQSLQDTINILKSKDSTIQEQKSKISKVSALVNEDALTGISNRRAYEDYIDGLMSGAFVPDSVPVMGIIDLDFFKKVNDTYGHPVGDFVLKEAARIISQTIREDSRGGTRSPDFFARIGGEEFVVIFTSVRLDSVHVGAQRILKRIKETTLRVPAGIASDGKSFEMNISASIGLAAWGKERFSQEEWSKEADMALYEAKRSGRGRVVLLKPERREWT